MNTENQNRSRETSPTEDVVGVDVPRLVVPLPCPFCGKVPKMDWHESYGGYKIRVIYCHAKKCHIKPRMRVAKLVGMKDADARANALACWNYRHNANVDLPDTAAQDSASKLNSPAVSG